METVNLPIISAFTAGILIVGQAVLTLTVIRLRRKARQSLGDGGHPELYRAIRRHGNYAENVAVFIACLALLEMVGASRQIIVGLAVAFVVGRVVHAIGLSLEKTNNSWRIAGTIATVGTGLALGWRLIMTGINHLL